MADGTESERQEGPQTDRAAAGRRALAAVRAGGKAALARALAELEQSPDAPATLALLDAAYAAPRARVVGLTGPPGVGKSTLLGRLIAGYRARALTLGVIAVDPSSKRSGGALLGDRVRLATDPQDAGIFVRSMAARDRLGGLADVTMAAMVLMRALYDRVLIETVGVGQSETDVAGAADTVVFCVQPASGDALQFMKAGIIEIPHVSVVTKADMGAPARRTLGDLKAALALAAPAAAPEDEAGEPRDVLAVSATTGAGVDDLMAAVERHGDWLNEGRRLDRRRRAQAEAWLRQCLRDRIGRDGLHRLVAAGIDLHLAPGVSPFARLAALARAAGGS
ncbi:MAG: methylmalonyl Co-A mutase-associated GTPase MeaB [Alphaproteobacteria bacterium]|nr:MAG: methylmalonyl Co-A mutase-associated GTPase MeaB [Alphaproteobacteria bacterium]